MLDATAAAFQHSQRESASRFSTDIRPLELETIPPQQVEALNAFYRPRPSLKFQFAGRNVRLSPTWLEEEPDISDPYTVTIKMDGHMAELVLPKSILELIFAHLDPSIPFDDLYADHRAIVLECVSSMALEKLEADLECTLSIVTVARGPNRWGGSDVPLLPMVLQIQGIGIAWCLLRLEPAYLLRFANLLNRAGGSKRPWLDVPAKICVRWASVRLSLEEVQTLKAGDIIMLDHTCGQPGVAVAVVEDHLIVPVALTQNGYRVTGMPRPAYGSGLEWSLPATHMTESDMVDASLGSVPLNVFFEYGRLHSSLQQIRTLSTDHVYPLVRPLQDGLDIVVNGATIGRGELTKIGNGIGVRVTRL